MKSENADLLLDDGSDEEALEAEGRCVGRWVSLRAPDFLDLSDCHRNSTLNGDPRAEGLSTSGGVNHLRMR